MVGTLVGLVDWREIERILSTELVAGMPQSEWVVLALLAEDPDEQHDVASDPHVAGSTGHELGHGGGHEILYITPVAAGLLGVEQLLGAHQEGIADEVDTPAGAYLVTSSFSRAEPPFADPHWELHAAVATDLAFAGLAPIRWQFGLMGVGFAAGAILIGWFGTMSLVRPMTQMIGVMRRLAAGDSEVKVPQLQRRDEVGEMARGLRCSGKRPATARTRPRACARRRSRRRRRAGPRASSSPT